MVSYSHQICYSEESYSYYYYFQANNSFIVTSDFTIVSVEPYTAPSHVLSTGGIIGIVIGSFAFILIIIVLLSLVVLFIKRYG